LTAVAAPCGEQPGTPPDRRTPVDPAAGVRAAGQPERQPSRALAAVEQDRPESEEREDHHEVVEQCGTGQHDRVPVDREEATGDRGEQGGIEELARDDHQQEHGEDADDGGADAPADGILGTEDPKSESYHPLAEWRMGDVGTALRIDIDIAGIERLIGLVGPGRLIAEVQKSPGILHIEGLVEHEGARIRQPHQSQHRGEQRDRDRPSPVPGALGAGQGEHAAPPGVEPGAGRFDPLRFGGCRLPRSDHGVEVGSGHRCNGNEGSLRGWAGDHPRSDPDR